MIVNIWLRDVFVQKTWRKSTAFSEDGHGLLVSPAVPNEK